MASDELEATTDVVTLADHVDGLGESVARRLDDAGVETVADILIADEGALTDVSYVSETRADLLRETADALVTVEPRDVDFEATESVVSEAAIPLSVRRGEAVLVGRGNDHVYHTRACANVTSDSSTKLKERSRDWADQEKYRECKLCADPNTHAEHGKQSALTSADPDPLVDPVDVVLEATLGEKLTLTMADRDGYANPWAVVDTEEPTTWEAPTGDTWQTRRIRISQKMNGAEHYSECDLVLGADEIRLEDPPVKRQSAQPDAPSWEVETAGAIGRVSSSTLAQLQGRQQQADAKPEGDDTWRQYQDRGEA